MINKAKQRTMMNQLRATLNVFAAKPGSKLGSKIEAAFLVGAAAMQAEDGEAMMHHLPPAWMMCYSAGKSILTIDEKKKVEGAAVIATKKL